MILRKPLTQTILATTLAATGAHANEASLNNAIPKLEEMTVTASRIEMPLRQVGSSVSVLTAEDLEQKNYPTLDAALRTLPSVGVSQSGGLGKATTVRIRGEEGHRTLLRVDGIDVSDPSATQIGPRFGHVLNSPWGRVEVLRGPQGMMYGADAGGVISVFSKESDEPVAADLVAEGGRYDTRRLNGNVRGTLDRFTYSVTASDLTSDGFNARVADETEDKDGYDNTTLHAKAGFAITDALGVGAVLRDVDAESQFDGCGFPASYNCLSDYQQQSARLNAHYATEKQRHELAYTHSETDNVNRVVDRDSYSLDSTGEREKWEYFGHYEFAQDLSFVFGADRLADSYVNNLEGETFERDQTGVFIEGQTSFADQLFYTVGLRYDDNEDFGEHTSYRLTAAYLLPVATGELKLKGGYSTGFRAPSLYEIAYNNREDAPTYVPSELSEETSRGYEVGIEWLFATNTRVELVWFDNTIDDEIFFDLAAFGGYLQAEGETDSEGVEFNASVELLDNLVLGGNYTYNKTRLSADTTLTGAEPGGPRARRPKHAYNLSARYNFWQNRINLAAFYRSSRDAVDYPYGLGRIDLDDYQVLDITGSWQVTDFAEVYLRWENVLDEDYQEIAGYHTAGTAGYAGARFTF